MQSDALYVQWQGRHQNHSIFLMCHRKYAQLSHAPHAEKNTSVLAGSPNDPNTMKSPPVRPQGAHADSETAPSGGIRINSYNRCSNFQKAM
jgi:hypothetical protein